MRPVWQSLNLVAAADEESAQRLTAGHSRRTFISDRQPQVRPNAFGIHQHNVVHSVDPPPDHRRRQYARGGRVRFCSTHGPVSWPATPMRCWCWCRGIPNALMRWVNKSKHAELFRAPQPQRGSRCPHAYLAGRHHGRTRRLVRAGQSELHRRHAGARGRPQPIGSLGRWAPGCVRPSHTHNAALLYTAIADCRAGRRIASGEEMMNRCAMVVRRHPCWNGTAQPPKRS